jgi:alkylation response protein AidB-like acyl-CoA dehydrogenase
MSVATARDETAEASVELQRLLRDSAAAFARRGGIARVRALRAKAPGFDRAVWTQMAGQGWLGILVPDEHGGQELGFAEMAVVVEELARLLAPEPLIGGAVLAAKLIEGGSNDRLKVAMLPKIASGETIIGAGLTGRFGALEPDGIGVNATPMGTDTLLNGAAPHVDPGPGADAFIIAARDTAGSVALYHVPANAVGLDRADDLRADGTFASTLTLSNVTVSAADRIASGETAVAAIRRAMDAASVMTSAALLGVMKQAFEITIDYLKTRVQFGKAIGSFQALQVRCVELYIQQQLAIGALADAVRTLDDPHASPDQISMAASRAKSRCGDAAHQICREAIKLHGAIGFTDEYDVGLYLRRAMTLNAWLGNPSEHRRRFTALLKASGSLRASNRDRESVPFSTVFLSDRKENVDWNSFSDREFRAGIRAWFEKNAPSHLKNLGRRVTPAEMKPWFTALAEKGWNAPAWPTQYGGMGLSPSKQIIYIEERERAGVPRTSEHGVAMLGPLLMQFGTEEQKKKYLPRILTNDDVWCQGYSEPNSGSDLASLQTEAVLDGDHYVINGSKIWTSGADLANKMFLLVRTARGPKKQEGISFLLIDDMKTPGLTVRPIEMVNGITELCQEYFENVRVPKENVVGEVNKGWTIAKSLLGFERLNSGSPRRPQAPLANLEQVARAAGLWDEPEFQSKYAKVYLDLEDLGSLYQSFCDAVGKGEELGPEVSQLKIFAAETTQRITELLMETAGGAGAINALQQFGDDMIQVIAPFYLVFPMMIASGSNDIQRNILAQRVLGLPT